MPAPASLYTAERAVRLALKDAGRLQIGSTPSGEVFAEAMGRLSDIINTTQTQGIKLWLNSIQSITLVDGTASYTLGPGGAILATKPLRVLEAWYVTSTGERRSLGLPLSWNDYYNLGNLTTEGAVNSYFVDKQATNLVVKFWNVPDAEAATGTVELQLQTQATAPIELDETLSFPIEWFMFLRWALADELSTGQPALIMERCQRKALEYRDLLEAWDVEDSSTRFAPSYQGQAQASSRFR